MAEAPGLVVEKRRLATLGASFLGIEGDQAHTFGAHLANPPASDYTLKGALNRPVGAYACAIDGGMDWPASRAWLRWLIREIREDRITGIFEVIGSLDGRTARYWSDSSGWSDAGVPYQGSGHVSWTHVAIYRSTALQDHGIYLGWTRDGYTGAGTPPTGGDDMTPEQAKQLAAVHHTLTQIGRDAGDGRGMVTAALHAHLGNFMADADRRLKALEAAAREPARVELRPEDRAAIADVLIGGLRDMVCGEVKRALREGAGAPPPGVG